MGFFQLAVDVDMGAWCAKVGGMALVFAIAAEELCLDADGEVLVLHHAGGGLAVEHDPAVAKRPILAIGCLLAHETVLDPQPIMRKRLFVKQVAIVLVKAFVAAVIYFYHAVFHSKGILVIVIEVETCNLDVPTVKVFAIEKLYPLALFGGFGAAAMFHGTNGKEKTSDG